MRHFILYLLCIMSATGLYAQTYNFNYYADEQGLKQSYIYCISQSRQGYLVFSSGEALDSFDGSVFTTLTDDHMKENGVVTHFIDSRNITWLGHQQHGISYVTTGHPKKFKDSLFAGVKISQIIEDKYDRIWLAGSNGLYSVDSSFKTVRLPLAGDKVFTSLVFDARQNLLAGSQQGLLVITRSERGSALSATEVQGLDDKAVKQVIAADATGLSYWVLADDAVYGISEKNGTYKIVTRIPGIAGDESFTPTGIFKDRADNLWISVFGKGLYKLSFRGNPMGGQFAVIEINRDNGLKSLNIQSVFQDAEGNMWFGTFGDGLIKKPAEVFSFFGVNEGIKITDVKKVVVFRSQLWMGTDEGLAALDMKTGSYAIYGSENGFVKDKVTALLLDTLGQLWIGTGEKGLYKLDIATRKFENVALKKKLKFSTINCIMRNGDKMMIGTIDGITVFNVGTSWNESLSTNDGLLHNNVKHIFRDSRQRVWVSSHGAPPYFIASQKITAFKKIAGLSAYNISAACEDLHGNIWIATDGDGVFKYDNKTFYNYNTTHGLLSNYCNGIEIDKNNSVWVTHRSGLSELREDLKKFTGFTVKKGLIFTENNTNAVYKDSAANLWFGTTQGVTAYNIERGKTLTEIPEIFITDVLLNKEHFISSDRIVKQYGYYSVHIEYKAISLTEPDAIYYKYRLTDGIDTNWKVTNMSYLDIPRLGDGEYKFEIIACNASKDVCSAVPASVTFTIEKPVWKRIWFYVLIGLLIVLASYGIIIYRTKALKKTQALLLKMVEEKTYLLKKEKEAVESIKTDLEYKNKDITASIHYAKNIQDSLLPPDELMKELFGTKHFVLYMPKDIVSGDFYWCSGVRTSHGHTLSLAAVIDCTGHGVPGAFLSILANDFLKQSLAEEHVKMPNEILDYLNMSISSHLNQHASKNKIRDGMDIALAGIDYEKNKLYYSGANNPIYIFRKNNGGVEEIILKATKQAIGSVLEITLKYELNTFDLQEGDMVYLFSDGYADQFGGTKDKKITYKTFRSILAQASLISIAEQKTFIEEKFQDWKGTTEQTDDVCVMGIRI